MNARLSCSHRRLLSSSRLISNGVASTRTKSLRPSRFVQANQSTEFLARRHPGHDGIGQSLTRSKPARASQPCALCCEPRARALLFRIKNTFCILSRPSAFAAARVVRYPTACGGLSGVCRQSRIASTWQCAGARPARQRETLAPQAFSNFLRNFE